MPLHLPPKQTVTDTDAFHASFNAQLPAAEAAGLSLLHLWHDADNPNDIYALFTVADRTRADAFMNDPASIKAGQQATVTDGWATYLTPSPQP